MQDVRVLVWSSKKGENDVKSPKQLNASVNLSFYEVSPFSLLGTGFLLLRKAEVVGLRETMSALNAKDEI